VSTLADLVLSRAALFMLVLTRIVGFVATSPFPGANVSNTQKVTLVGALSWIACSFASSEVAPRAIDGHLVVSAIVELGCGILIGLAFRFVLSAADVLGQTVSHSVGLSTAAVLNPSLETQDSALSRIITLFAMLVALGAGAHRVAISYLLESFRAMPVGTNLDFAAPVSVFVDLAGSAVAVGVRLAMPAIAIGLVVQIALALVARAAPSLQIFSIGFAVLVAAGLAAIAASLDRMIGGLLDHLHELGDILDAILGLAHGR
jgi:flagellar biosynthetic protein FliR